MTKNQSTFLIIFATSLLQFSLTYTKTSDLSLFKANWKALYHENPNLIRKLEVSHKKIIERILECPSQEKPSFVMHTSNVVAFTAAGATIASIGNILTVFIIQILTHSRHNPSFSEGFRNFKVNMINLQQLLWGTAAGLIIGLTTTMQAQSAASTVYATDCLGSMMLAILMWPLLNELFLHQDFLPRILTLLKSDVSETMGIRLSAIITASALSPVIVDIAKKLKKFSSKEQELLKDLGEILYTSQKLSQQEKTLIQSLIDCLQPPLAPLLP